MRVILAGANQNAIFEKFFTRRAACSATDIRRMRATYSASDGTRKCVLAEQTLRQSAQRMARKRAKSKRRLNSIQQVAIRQYGAKRIME